MPIFMSNCMILQIYLLALWKESIKMSDQTDFVRLDKYLTRHGYFALKKQDPYLLEPIWFKTEHDYNKALPKSAQKTHDQLSKALRKKFDKIRKSRGLDSKEDRDEIVTVFKTNIAHIVQQRAAQKTIGLLK